MADLISDFNVVSELTRAPAAPESDANSMEASNFRRNLHELEMIRDSLPEPARGDLTSTISSLQAQFSAGGITPSTVNALQAARHEAAQYTSIASKNQQAALFDTFTVSAAARARVDASMAALRRGDFADYYFLSNPNHGLNAEAQAHFAQVLANDPVYTQQAAVLQRAPQVLVTNAHMAQAADAEEIDALIAAAAPNSPEQQALIQAKNAGVAVDAGRMQQVREAVATGNVAGIVAATEQSIAEQAQHLRNSANLRPGTSSYLTLMQIPELRTADGYALDFDAVIRYRIEHQDEITAAANTPQGQRTPEQQQLAGFGDVTRLASAQWGISETATRVMLEAARSEPDLFRDQILNQDMPAESRAQLLKDELIERYRTSGESFDEARVLSDARTYIRVLDQNPNARATILQSEGQVHEVAQKFNQDFNTNYTQIKIDQGLADMGFSGDDVTRLNGIAAQNPELAAVLKNSFASKGATLLGAEKQRTLFTNILTNGGEPNTEALSIINYYNLSGNSAGSSLQGSIYMGEIDPAVALQKAESLRQESITRMDAYAELVPSNLPPERREILSNAGLIDATGKINVSELIEKARVNRDALGQLNDQQLAAITGVAWEDLDAAGRERRVIAQAAVSFKAIDAVQVFKQGIDDATARIGSGQQSAELQADIALYQRMVNEGGQFTAQEQRESVDSFLQRQQYLRTTPDLRARMVDYVIDTNERTDIFRQQEVAVKVDKPMDAPTVEVAAAAPQAPNAEQAALAAPIQAMLNNTQMHDIVSSLGGLLGRHNVGQVDVITSDEIQSALTEVGVTNIRQIGNGDNEVTTAELVDALRQGNFTPPATAITGASQAAGPDSQAVVAANAATTTHQAASGR